MLPIALQYLSAGLSVLPAKRSDKRPAVGSWKPYRKQRPTAAEINTWFSYPQDGLCIIAGAASGNLEIIDFDNGGELFDAWYSLVNEAASDILPRLVIETSQSGGLHVVYRCGSPVCGNMKLAQRKMDGEVKTLIETRGEGGLFLCSPTSGYEIKQGQFTELPVLSSEQRDILLEAAWALNEWIPKPAQIPAPSVHQSPGLRPGDDYNARGDIKTLLQSHGWTCVKGGENEYWRRPGKPIGWSATLKDGIFFVWSSNAAPFEHEKPYSPFGVYALLEHNGNFKEAAAELSKQGYGQSAPLPPNIDVDISAIVDRPKKHLLDPGPIPESFFQVPGFIERVMDFCLKTAPYPNRALAFCGALALQSFLAGRKIKEPGGIRSNIYLLALANTGTGKDWPRKINVNIMNYINASQCLGNRFASGEGLQDVMFANLNMLFQTDEIDTMLRSMTGSRDGRYESIMDTLLTFYTSSDSSFPMRTKAGMKECLSIWHPHLSIFGTATPRSYYQALSERMMTNGFFSRMLIIDVGERPLCQKAGDIDNIPADILGIAEYWQEKTRPSQRHNLCWENPKEPSAEYLEEAEDILFEFQRQSDLNHRASDANNEVSKAIWSRAAENARKLALLYACSENHLLPAITNAAAKWAIEFVNHQIRRQLYMASIYAAENKFHADCLKLKEKLRNEPGHRMQHGRLLKNMHLDRETFKKLIDTLLEQGDIEIEPMPQVTKKGVVYALCASER